MTPPAAIRAMPILQVKDLDASIAFYARLRFAPISRWDNFAMVQRGDVTIGLGLSDAPPDTSDWTSAYLYVADADATYREFTGAGFAIDGAPEDRFYGCRDFELSDPDGHRLVFGQDISGATRPGLAEPNI